VELTDFVGEVTQWAEERPDIVGLAMVGSHARDAGRPDSDVDLVVLCADPSSLVHRDDWTARFGEVRDVGMEDYGAVRSLRVFYQDGLEVEFGITDSTWARVPLDAGTRKVISDGIRILYDPRGLLREAKNATAA
jgi:predicted nucleotidyltransferase